MNVSDRVKLARQKRGLSQRGLADKADLSNAYVQQLEHTGEGASIKEPGLTSLQQLATALDVPVEWLAFGSGDEPSWSPSEEPAA
jgi:transcriptional regulator with XRE-family HTH domain